MSEAAAKCNGGSHHIASVNKGETAPPGSRKATFAEACGLEIYPLFTDAK